jgi:uncharacterized repeat protein (TIGR01451 family)
MAKHESRLRAGGSVARRRRRALTAERLERRELLTVDVSAVGESVGSVIREFNQVVHHESLTYKVTITNNGEPARVVLTDVVDPRIMFPTIVVSGVDSSDYTGHYQPSEHTLTVTFPALAGTVVVSIDVGFVSPSPTRPPYANDFSIATDEENTNPQTSGSISVDVPSPGADVSLTCQVDATPIRPGSDVTYTFIATNNSTDTTAPESRIVVKLPSAWDGTQTGFSVDRNPGWAATMESRGGGSIPPTPYLTGFTYAIGDLAPGESRSVSLTLYPQHSEELSPMLAFPALLITDIYDYDASNNLVNVATPLVPTIKIRLDPVETNPLPMPVGGDLTYTFHLANESPNRATGLVVHQTLPAGTTFVSAMLNGAPITGTVAGGILTIALPDLNGHWGIGALVVTLSTAGVSVNAATPLSGPVEVTWNEFPGSVHGVTAMGTVTPRGTLSIAMNAIPVVQVNQTLFYTYTVTNPYATDAHNLDVSITLPPQSQMGLLPGPYTVVRTATAQVVTFHLADLPAGASHSFTILTVPLVAGKTHATGALVEASRPASDYAPVTVDSDVLEWSHVEVRRLDAPDGTLKFVVTNYGPSPTGVNVNADWVDSRSVTRDGVPLSGVWSLDQTPVPGWMGPVPPPLDHGPPYGLWSGVLAAGASTVFEMKTSSPSARAWVTQNMTDHIPGRLATGASIDPPPTVPISVVAGLATDVATVATGGYATFTATATNIGPFNGENVTLRATIPPNSRLVAVSPGVVVTGNILTFTVANLPVGATGGFQYVVSPTWNALGTAALTSRLDVQAAQPFVVDPAIAATSSTIGVTAGPSGSLVLGSTSYTVDETAGSVAIVVNRVGGVSGALSLGYTTVAVDAVGGVDFTPVWGTLDFADGETSKTIVVPILANPRGVGDRTFQLYISGGASALVTIRDVIPPTVASYELGGGVNFVTAIRVTFAQPMAASTVLDPANYLLVSAGRDLKFGTRDDLRVRLRPSYNPSTQTVTLTPVRRVPTSRFYQLTVLGGGVLGADGAALAGDGATPGTDYAVSLSRRTPPRPVPALIRRPVVARRLAHR